MENSKLQNYLCRNFYVYFNEGGPNCTGLFAVLITSVDAIYLPTLWLPCGGSRLQTWGPGSVQARFFLPQRTCVPFGITWVPFGITRVPFGILRVPFGILHVHIGHCTMRPKWVCEASISDGYHVTTFHSILTLKPDIDRARPRLVVHAAYALVKPIWKKCVPIGEMLHFASNWDAPPLPLPLFLESLQNSWASYLDPLLPIWNK